MSRIRMSINDDTVQSMSWNQTLRRVHAKRVQRTYTSLAVQLEVSPRRAAKANERMRGRPLTSSVTENLIVLGRRYIAMHATMFTASPSEPT